MELSEATNCDFSYWSTFYGDDEREHQSDISLIDKSITNLVENKGRVARKVIEFKLQSIFPDTFFSVSDALSSNQTCSHWFAKPVHLSGGRGIECVSPADLNSYQLPQHTILQAGVENLLLLNNRKFTGRIYLLVWNKRLWMFDDGWLMIHGVDFDPESNSYEIHVDHRGYQEAGSSIKMKLLSDLDSQPKLRESLTISAAALKPLFKEQLSASDKGAYLMAGIDFLVQRDGTIKFIEINAIPNFVHTPEINCKLNIPFFVESLRLMLDLPYRRLVML